MTQPSAHTLYDVIDQTWPAAKKWTDGPFTLRRGDGGGSRVSAATLDGVATNQDVARAAQAMQDMGQPALFMLKDRQDDFDAQLDGAATFRSVASNLDTTTDDLAAMLDRIEAE